MKLKNYRSVLIIWLSRELGMSNEKYGQHVNTSGLCFLKKELQLILSGNL